MPFAVAFARSIAVSIAAVMRERESWRFHRPAASYSQSTMHSRRLASLVNTLPLCRQDGMGLEQPRRTKGQTEHRQVCSLVYGLREASLFCIV